MPLSDMCEYSDKSTIFSKTVVLIRFKYLRQHHAEKIRTASFLSTTMLRSEAISGRSYEDSKSKCKTSLESSIIAKTKSTFLQNEIYIGVHP